MEIPPEDMEICLRVLHKIANSYGTITRSEQFNSLISKVYREGKRYDLIYKRNVLKAEDRALQATTSMVKIQRDALPAAVLPPPSDHATGRKLNKPEACYICKEDFTDLHFFYHLLCPKCAELNYKMRHLSADLTGRTAVVTGGRVKIGHQIVLRMLRDGAKVIVTTRFPHAAAKRLYSEPGSKDWAGRLEIHGLDLRNIPAVEAFADYLVRTEPAIDILIHNAAQTIRRPNGFYRDLIAQEQQPQLTLPLEAIKLVHRNAPSTLALTEGSNFLPSGLSSLDILPADSLEDNEERADSRDVNSWLLRLDEVSALEMLEVQLVNSVAPFLLNSRLKSLLMRSSFNRRFIVNVSAMEGQFSRNKTVYHPHTNMAKAALNMMTRTSGDDYAKDRIYMNSVDTGWVTDENPTPKRTRVQTDSAFYPPLDIIDGMARIYHPIASGINESEEPLFGMFLKDYTRCLW